MARAEENIRTPGRETVIKLRSTPSNDDSQFFALGKCENARDGLLILWLTYYGRYDASHVVTRLRRVGRASSGGMHCGHQIIC
jgi:hypothetical protein